MCSLNAKSPGTEGCTRCTTFILLWKPGSREWLVCGNQLGLAGRLRKSKRCGLRGWKSPLGKLGVQFDLPEHTLWLGFDSKLEGERKLPHVLFSPQNHHTCCFMEWLIYSGANAGERRWRRRIKGENSTLICSSSPPWKFFFRSHVHPCIF